MPIEIVCAGLALKIVALADEDNLRARLGASARQRVFEHSWARYCEPLERVFLWIRP